MCMKNIKTALPCVLEFVAPLLVIFTHFMCLFYLQWGIFIPLATIISVAPPLFFYFVLRFFVSALFASVVVSMALVFLSIANQIKFFTTIEPMSWADISNLFISKTVIVKYITITHVSLFVFCLVLLLLAKYVSYLYPQSWNKKSFLGNIFICIFLFPIAFYPYFLKSKNPLTQKKIEKTQEKLKVYYLPGLWNTNIKKNGLPMHLVQTSVRRIPKKATLNEKKLYEQLNFAESNLNRSKQIVFILCESCWYDEQNFSEVFTPLRSRGFVEFRAVAPVYGGGTVNSTFEMLAGLPAKNNVLDGILYQEYATNFSSSVTALPNVLKKEGYRTYSIHNGTRNFWRRNIVEPKLGFEKFISMMEMTKYIKFFMSGDKPLFYTALDVAKSHLNENFFLHLANAQTHGPYNQNQDNGAEDYKIKISSKLMPYLTEFLDEFAEIAPNALIVIYGDHKPYLENFYSQKKLIQDSSSWEQIGDIPIWIKSPLPAEEVQEFAQKWSGSPLFCLAVGINTKFIGANIPAFHFNQSGVCPAYFRDGYLQSVDKIPEWLYSLSLFE